MRITRSFILAFLMAAGTVTWAETPAKPIGLIFDTDIGNDIDDALALSVIHAFESRGECKLLAVTITKDNPYAGPFIDAVNTFYGRGDIPIGMAKEGKTPDEGKYLRPIAEDADYPHDLTARMELPSATQVLREALSAQPDGSVVIVQVGFSTNLARLIASPPDSISDLDGLALARKKCKLLSMMAGNFSATEHVKEYNIVEDISSAKSLLENWPTPIVLSGFEIGRAIKYPAESILRDYRYVPKHPVAEAYKLYQKMPYDRETWDLTSVLYAVRPDRGYFGLSDPGSAHVDEASVTQFNFDPKGKHRYLTVSDGQVERVREALIQLVSSPPGRR